MEKMQKKGYASVLKKEKNIKKEMEWRKKD